MMSQPIEIPLIRDEGILKLFLYRLHEISFSTTDYGNIHVTSDSNQRLNITFEKEGSYSLKIYSILDQHEKLMLEANHAEPSNQQILATIQRWITDNNIEIAKHLDSSRDVDRELTKFDRVLKNFCNLNHIKCKEVDSTGNGVRDCHIITSGEKPLTITSFDNGTIMTQGSYSKYHEEFWKLYLEIQEKTLENKNEKKSY